MNILKEKYTKIILVWYFILLTYWIFLQVAIFPYHPEAKLALNPYNLFFSVPYYMLGVLGGINGLFISKKYGGWHSALGRALIFLSLALLGQGILGNFLWLLYYNLYLHVEIPYPALTDIGFFSVIPLNMLALINFGYLSGARFSLKKMQSKIIGISIGVFFFGLAYILFLQDVKIDLVHTPIKTFLDFGYPLGEAFNITLAVIIFLNSKKSLGGRIKAPLLFIIFHFVLVFIADNSFTLTNAHGWYYNSSFVDLIYATQCLTGSIGLLMFKNFETK